MALICWGLQIPRDHSRVADGSKEATLFMHFGSDQDAGRGRRASILEMSEDEQTAFSPLSNSDSIIVSTSCYAQVSS